MMGGSGVDFRMAAGMLWHNQKKRVFDVRYAQGQVGENLSVGSALRSGIAFTLAALMLPGCAVLGGGSKPLDTYELTAPAVPSRGARKTGVQILISQPTALKALDSQNIVVQPQPGSIEYLAGAQWSDRLPEIVQSRLVEAFDRSGRVGGVGRPGEGLAIDYRILADIRKFGIIKDGGERAQIEMNIQVLNDRNGVVRGSRTFSASVPVTGSGNDALAFALDQAFEQIAVDIVGWSTRRM
jgi:cholesterol transport system auxiliary component